MPLLLRILRPFFALNLTGNTRNCLKRLYTNDSGTIDPYEVLGVKPDVSFTELRDQYMKLSKQYHPDYNLGDKHAEAKFIKLNKAYKVLVAKVERNQHHKKSETAESKNDYDFTVEPLGVETEKPEPILPSRSFGKFAAICVGVIAVAHVLRSVLPAIGTNLEEWASSKTAEETEKEFIEETRQALINYHRKKEKLQELYEKASR